MSSQPVKLPQELNNCVNEFLALANTLHRSYTFDSVSASALYAAARYNVHGFVNQDSPSLRADFVAYMTELYLRMLNEQLDLQLAERAERERQPAG
jgi:hypothetical protein